jgi:branched-chain amino acid transport system permease protein/neutral amino acid transport system permease protein
MELVLYRPFQRAGLGVIQLAMAALALNLIVVNIILAIAGPNLQVYRISRETTFHIGPIEWTPRQVVIMLLALIAMGATHALLRWTRLGKAMRATADDPALAATSGIDSRRVRTVAWLLSGALCGLCGVTLALNTITFSSSTADTFILLIVAAALVGGIGDPYGAMLGALAIGLVTDVAAIFTTTLNELIAFAFLAVLMIVRPNGLRAVRQVELWGESE